jgi:hypothetical protein
VDTTLGLSFGMDLTPLVKDDSIDPVDYIQQFVARFAEDVQSRLGRVG